METSHSLPISPQRVVTQLPFSPSPSTPSYAAQRMQSQNRPRGGSVASSAAAPHNRSGSIISSRSRTTQNPILSGELFTPAPPLPLFQPRSPNATYSGGIPPSAAFFHPLRPGQASPSLPSFARPSSPGSIVSASATAPVHIDIAPFTREDTRDTGYDESLNMSSTEDLPHPAKSTKHSRDPLLPVGRARGATVSSRPSIAISGPYGKSEASISAGGRMRGSFEKLFRRGLSFEAGARRSPGGVHAHTGGQGQGEDGDPAAACISRSRQASPVTPSAHHGTFDLAPRAEEGLARYKAATAARRSSASLTHSHSHSGPLSLWDPVRPTDVPPLDAVPRLTAKGAPMRAWHTHPSQNRFFCGGRALTGGDAPWAFGASLALLLGIAGAWFGTTCVWWWRHASPAVAAVGAYVCLLTISSMCATAFRDPGILPRNLDPDPPSAGTASEESSRVPLPRDLRVRAGVVRVKYCPTCRTYRPPRSSHCKMCDNCVDGCDHHCQWVNNCVGRRNYTSFFTFLLSAVLTLILVICTTALHLWLLTRPSHGSLTFKQALATPLGTGSAVAFSLSILVVWPVTALAVYHARLLLLNITTIEQIRNQAHKSLGAGPAPPNPFSHGTWRRNLLYVLGRPPGYSWLDFSARATEDRRKVNPGLVQDGEGPQGGAWAGRKGV